MQGGRGGGEEIELCLRTGSCVIEREESKISRHPLSHLFHTDDEVPTTSMAAVMCGILMNSVLYNEKLLLLQV